MSRANRDGEDGDTTRLVKLQQDWDDLAKIDPMWAICSDPAKQQGKWPVTDFFTTGRHQLRNVLETIGSLGVVLSRGVALDFGCGLGRLTQALAEEFDRVYGVDISREMIERAERLNKFGEKCKYVVNPMGHLRIFDDDSFDFIYTDIVLQHMPPGLMLGYIREFIRTLKVEGILVFRVPIQRLDQDIETINLRRLPKYHPKRIWNKLRGLLVGHDQTDRYYRLAALGLSKSWLYNRFGFRPEIQMHTLDEAVIRKLIIERGAKLIKFEKQADELSKMLYATVIVLKPI
jgi:SAM-dependent methyltransferase